MNSKDDKNNFRGKLIPVRDYIYLTIILIIGVISIVSMTLSDSTRAGENLNFAATLTSIILAVLAIVITLVESVAQKENIKKLEELSHVMNESIDRNQRVISNTFEKSEEHVQTMINLKEELTKHYEVSIKSLRENIYQYASQEKTLNKEEIDKIFKNAIKEMNSKLTLEKNSRGRYVKDTLADFVYNHFEFSHDKYIPKEEIMKFIKGTLLSIGSFNDIELELEATNVFKELLDKHGLFYQHGMGYTELPF